MLSLATTFVCGIFLLALLSGGICLVDAAPPDQIEEYQRLFPANGVTEIVFNSSKDLRKLYSIIVDPANPEDFLASTYFNTIVHLSSSQQTATNIVGVYGTEGFENGPGHLAKFNYIVDLIYVESLKKVLVCDVNWFCLRTFDRNELDVSTYAGKCFMGGGENGHRLDATFGLIEKIQFDERLNVVYMLEWSTGKLRVLSIETEQVTTLVEDASKDFLWSMSIPPEGVDNMLWLNGDYIYEYSSTGFIEMLDASNHQLRRMHPLSSSLHLAIDLSIGGVQLFYMTDKSLTPLCVNESINSSINVANCTFNITPDSLTISKGSVYAASVTSSQVFIKSFKMNCSAFKWDSWGACNASEGIGTQTSTQGYTCVGHRLCWNKPTRGTDEGESYYIRVKQQCTLGEKLPTARSMIDCASYCSSTDTCEAYSYNSTSRECRTATTILPAGSADCYLKAT